MYNQISHMKGEATMSISKSYNKQNGVTYVYEVTQNYWDKEKKRSQTKRKLIGKIDPETNEIVPTSKKKKHAGKEDGNDYKSLYENAIKEVAHKDDSLAELKAALIDEQAYLVEMEAEIKKRKKAIDSLLRKVKNHG